MIITSKSCEFPDDRFHLSGLVFIAFMERRKGINEQNFRLVHVNEAQNVHPAFRIIKHNGNIINFAIMLVNNRNIQRVNRPLHRRASSDEEFVASLTRKDEAFPGWFIISEAVKDRAADAEVRNELLHEDSLTCARRSSEDTDEIARE